MVINCGWVKTELLEKQNKDKISTANEENRGHAYNVYYIIYINKNPALLPDLPICIFISLSYSLFLKHLFSCFLSNKGF